ncbi:MAG: Gfo/Idh/MocA family oxidoreductase [Bryobacteraceae bacterium]
MYLTRRHFLAGAPALALAQANPAKLKTALIGCGWYGMVDVNAALKNNGVEIVALSDVDSQHLKESAAEIEKSQGVAPKLYKDYREMLDHPGLEALIIGTPPHWHALPFIAACRKGLSIYCEKPIAYDIREGRAMVEAWKKAGNVVQIGFQRRQSDSVHDAKAYIDSGKPGRIVQVDAQIHYSAGTPDPTPQDPPASLDWDAWCGPAPKLPYSPAIGHKSWRLEKAYGHGHLIDWGIHLIDATRVILGESTPKSVTAIGGLYELKGKITTPDTLTAHFEFERCPVVWRHRIWGATEYAPEVTNGIFLYGENETVFVTDSKWIVMPKAKGEPRREMAAKLTGDDMQVKALGQWLTAVRQRDPKAVACTPEDGYTSTATVQLATIAYETGNKVTWDARTEQIQGNVEAAKLLKRPYRAPYHHPHA